MTRLFARAGKVPLIIEQRHDGTFLYEFRADGFVGDTWHLSIEDAKAQATYAFGNAVGEWLPIPPDVADLEKFARENSN